MQNKIQQHKSDFIISKTVFIFISLLCIKINTGGAVVTAICCIARIF